MNRRFLSFSAVLLAALLSACATQPTAPVVVDLGTTALAAELFSYPNCRPHCTADEPTLEATIKMWMESSVKRDGYADASVQVAAVNGDEMLTITGVPSDYGHFVGQYMQGGVMGLKGAAQLKADGKWGNDWYYFLTLGLALRNQPTVQLLHFPPDTVMNQTHDELAAATTKRWASLLVMNGVPADGTDAYQRIMNIAPIAAPASAGSALEGVYSYFDDYSSSLIRDWTAPKPGTSTPRPMVAFGSPARSWLASYYKLAPVGVLTLTRITPAPGQTVPVLGTNHPSYIWYASDPKQYGGDQAKADAAGLVVMQQDVTAACWQAKMGARPEGNAQAVLDDCTTHWKDQQKDVCVAFYVSVRKITPEDAKKTCDQTL